MSRLPQLLQLHEQDPSDVDLLYMIGNEYFRERLYIEALDWLGRYVDKGSDVGAALGLMAECCGELGRDEDARATLRWGIEAARRAGHPSMAGEFQARLDDMA